MQNEAKGKRHFCRVSIMRHRGNLKRLPLMRRTYVYPYENPCTGVRSLYSNDHSSSGFRFQICSLYSWMVRSEENTPEQAVFMTAILSHLSLSV